MSLVNKSNRKKSAFNSNSVNDTRVITITGKDASRSSCVMIKGEYHIIGEECVKIGERYYSKYNNELYEDYYTKEWKVCGINTINGIVDYQSGRIIMGKFENSKEQPYINTSSGTYFVYDQSVLERIPLLFNHGTNQYNIKNNIAYTILENRSSMSIYTGISRYPSTYNYSFRREYSASKLIPLFERVDRRKLLNNKEINKSHIGEFGDFSFGLEFETSSGNISESDCLLYGLIPLKDGSISGNEFTTIPMKGEQGFSLLLNQIEKIKENTDFNKECSLHVHFGNFPINNKSILALNKLLYNVQDEIGMMFPYWIYQTRSYKHSGKDYCNKINNHPTFESLYRELSGRDMDYAGSLTQNHPLDGDNEHKWQVSPRYKWVNLVNLCFKKTGKTVEFRIHTPTSNKEKIINWMFICSALLKYTMINTDSIIAKPSTFNISLDHILRSVYSEDIYKQLSQYIVKRIEYFSICRTELCDNFGCFDMIEDANQKFGTNLVGE